LNFRLRQFLFTLFFCIIGFQYLFNLSGVGVLEPDEPRYAAIGRQMALSGDWITPRLWGSPWFEKPAMLYWLTALGTKLHLSLDLAGRVPVALLSLAFLVAWRFLLQREFGALASSIATLLLATSASWMVYSGFCLTDIPLAVFFSLAVVYALRLLRDDAPRLDWFALGVVLGLATLAKGLVPVVLATPLLWFLRRSWRRWPLAALAFLAVAAPWYTLVYWKNGFAFIQVFFLQQQFSRLYSQALQHVRPVYFYVPVLLLSIFPWTPLLFALRPKDWKNDQRLLCLSAVVLFGFVFFSISLNKLFGYLLPLLPSLFALLGVSLAKTRAYEQRAFLIPVSICVALLPLLAQLTPTALTSKLSFTGEQFLVFLPITLTTLVVVLTPLLIGSFGRKPSAGILLLLCCSIAVMEAKSTVYPILDEQASPRSFWKQIAAESDRVCDAGLHRAWQYGLAFYRGMPIPTCDQRPQPVHLIQNGRQRATIAGPQAAH
jgi:4-amino-4-deoxy-L-arabinose transferase-like glycosyltransferase